MNIFPNRALNTWEKACFDAHNALRFVHNTSDMAWHDLFLSLADKKTLENMFKDQFDFSQIMFEDRYFTGIL